MVFAADLGRNHDVFQRRQRGQQLEILKNETDGLIANARKIVLAGAVQRDAVKLD